MTGALPSVDRIHAVIQATWPAMDQWEQGGWIIRNGAGAGRRVSAASLAGHDLGDIAVAEAQMQHLGQAKLFQIRQAGDALDTALAARGYTAHCVTNIYACDIDILRAQSPEIAQSFAIWEPVAVMREIWAAGGINAARLACMQRCTAPKTAILARTGDSPAGVGFVAVDGDCAMIHAVEVRDQHRRKGVAGKIMCHAAHWAADNGAKYMTLVTTAENKPANMLYRNLGMAMIGQYHYRIQD